MGGHKILALIDAIAATSSRTEKEGLLTGYIREPLLQKVLKATYDPFTTYGITPEKIAGVGEWDIGDARIWTLLDGLATRRLTGNLARHSLTATMSQSTPATAELLWRILSKDMRAGFTAGTVNRVMPGLIPVFEVQLSHKYEPKRIKKWPVWVEPKLDGLRAVCIVHGGEAKFYSRTGKEFTALAGLGVKVVEWITKVHGFLKHECSAYLGLDGKVGPKNPSKARYLEWVGGDSPSVVLEGEILAGGFAETSGATRRKSEQAETAEYHVFDMIPYDVFTSDAKGWSEAFETRRFWLGNAAYHIPKGSPVRLVHGEFAHSHEEIMAIYERHRDTKLADYLGNGHAGDQVLEGAIVKTMLAPYEKRRSFGWLKMKASETEDLPISGFFEGEGRLVGNLGGIIVDRPFKGGIVKVRVGGGFSDADRAEIWANQAAYLGKMVEIEAHEETPDGSLRHPRYVRMRPDKDAGQEAA